ncbi:hypothetical protein DDZ18_04460 [Marinicauda salina]|uniref:VTT domain-containing protein n=2 Tax=Marinicauda salina TaxID=2135793 RepID=A0A2U2BXX7_9PROT|nr:hypothetical protein DDZ18_04460 [Marinicauda salina]
MKTMTRRSNPLSRGLRRWRRRLRVFAGRLDRAARGPHALAALFAGSVIESTVFPWPIEFPLLARMLQGRAKVFPAAAVVTLGSALGCLIAYLGGVAAWDALSPVIAEPGARESALAAARERIDRAGALAVFLGMMTPLPVQITSFAAGLAGVNPALFLAAVLAGRTVRYFSMAVLVYAFGERITAWWRARPPALRAAGVGAFLLAFIAAAVWVATP